MDLSHLTKVVKYEITKDGFIFYDENGNIPDPSNSYWDGYLDLYGYKGKSLKGLPNVVNGWLSLACYKGKSLKGLPSVVDGSLWLYNHKGESLEGLPSVVNGVLDLYNYNGESLKGLPNILNERLYLNSYKGNNYHNLPKEYREIYIKGQWHTKAEFDNFWKTEKLKKALLD